MGNDVFANGREIACKSSQGKSICIFPDVCMTPPENPATPPGVPIPYPNTGMASDTTKGSKTVKITKKEVMLKNKSHFKKSMGDEAGSAAKKGVVTSVNRGKVFFMMWSMDVKFEGQNVDRHLDMTTHNHASPPGNTPPGPFLDSMAPTPPVPGLPRSPPEDWDCDQLNDGIEKLTSAPTKAAGGGSQGLKVRFEEQIKGAQRPGSDGWKYHDDQIKGLQNKLVRYLRKHEEKGCGDPPKDSYNYATRPRPTAADYIGRA